MSFLLNCPICTIGDLFLKEILLESLYENNKNKLDLLIDLSTTDRNVGSLLMF